MRPKCIPTILTLVWVIWRRCAPRELVDSLGNELTAEYGERMDPLLRLYRSKLYGIINGIDYEVFNPATDTNLATRYDIDSIERKVENKLALQKELGLPQRPEAPLIGLISRLYDQKGLDLIANMMWGLMRLDLQLVVLGAGEGRYEDLFRVNARDNPQKLSATIGFKPSTSTPDPTCS